MKRILAVSLVCILMSTTSFASQIIAITLSELKEKADLIVLGQVTKLVKEEDQDHVTIQVGSYLKGENLQDVYTFTLVSRGGLKDFDPALKVGDTGVFFLKSKKLKGQVEKAYWGSIATFQKNNFYIRKNKTE